MIEEWSSLPPDSEIACYSVSRNEVRRYHLRGEGAQFKYCAFAGSHRHAGWLACKSYLGLPDSTKYIIILDEDFVARCMSLGNALATKQVLRNVLIHEYGHILQYRKFGKGGHDSVFRYYMRLAGAPELRYCGKTTETITPSCPMTWGEFFQDYDLRD